MSSEIVLASNNKKKVDELRGLLAEFVPHLTVVGLDRFPNVHPTVESGATFAENALLKARDAMRATGLTSIADDSGLEVTALNNMPGVLSARWSGEHGDDRSNYELLLKQLTDVPDERRSARFVCVVAIVSPDGLEHTVEGELLGSIIRMPRGSNGFGYDPIFLPAGQDRTSAELSAFEKNQISHRGKALRGMASWIRKNYS